MAEENVNVKDENTEKNAGYCKIALMTDKIEHFTSKKGTEMIAYPAPRDTQIDGEQIGNAKFVVPANCVKDIDPNHPKAKDYETPEFAENHKYLIANRDFEITFKRSYRDENSETGFGEFTKETTIGAYEKALKDRNRRHQKNGNEAQKEVQKEAKETAGGGAPEKQVDAPAK